MKDKAQNHQELLARLPAIDQLQQHPAVQSLCESYPEKYVTNCVRKVVEEIRQRVIDGAITKVEAVPGSDVLAYRVGELVAAETGHKLRRAINGAGVILHTGLGRAPLAPSAQAALLEATTRYCILATEQETGKRGDRNRHTADMLQELTGAEDSLIVNNNSAAVMLALNTFGKDREAIVSRGELVEIGGSFRVPDVMQRSRTIMVEVGTTNKTHLRDYREAITEETSILLKVHTSNYRIEGFHGEVPIRDLKPLAEEHNLLIIHDIGSGALVDLRRWGLTYEPTVPEAIADGADIVTFSGDKLLGGPQCGVIVGGREYIDRMKRNPLMRVFRCDKLILSALDGTLKLFLDPDKLPETHPIYEMMTTPLNIVNRRALRIAQRIRAITGSACKADVMEGFTEMGSGALPARPIPSRVVSLSPKGITAQRLGQELRMAAPPLFTRIENDMVFIDARTISDKEVRLITEVFSQVIREKGNPKSWSMRGTVAGSAKTGSDEEKLPALG